MRRAVDFIEGHPVRHFLTIALQHRGGKAREVLYHLAVFPAAKRFCQMQRHFIMGKGNNRLNSVGKAGINNVVIMRQASLIRLLFHAVEVDAGPGDGEAIAFESHLCEQRNILTVTMIVVDTFVVGIGVTRGVSREVKIRG